MAGRGLALRGTRWGWRLWRLLLERTSLFLDGGLAPGADIPLGVAGHDEVSPAPWTLPRLRSHSQPSRDGLCRLVRDRTGLCRAGRASGYPMSQLRCQEEATRIARSRPQAAIRKLLTALGTLPGPASAGFGPVGHPVGLRATCSHRLRLPRRCRQMPADATPDRQTRSERGSTRRHRSCLRAGSDAGSASHGACRTSRLTEVLSGDSIPAR